MIFLYLLRQSCLTRETEKKLKIKPSHNNNYNLQKLLLSKQYPHITKKSYTYGGGVVPTISHLLCPFDTTERSDVLVLSICEYEYLTKRRTTADPLPDRSWMHSNATYTKDALLIALFFFIINKDTIRNISSTRPCLKSFLVQRGKL